MGWPFRARRGPVAHKQGMLIDTPYCDAWRNKVVQRGGTRSDARFCHKGPFTNDVSSEGEEGVGQILTKGREFAWIWY